MPVKPGRRRIITGVLLVFIALILIYRLLAAWTLDLPAAPAKSSASDVSGDASSGEAYPVESPAVP